MEKKKIIIAILSVVIVVGIVVGFASKGKDKPKEVGLLSVEGAVVDDENQPPILEGNGTNINDFESEIIELGYVKFEDGSYDYFEKDISIVLIQIEEEVIKLSLSDKANISNEAVKSAIALLIPNEMESLMTTINECTTEIATSLDNRTVSIIVTDNELELFISN